MSDRDEEYKKRLSELPEEQKKELLQGNWNTSEEEEVKKDKEDK